MRKRRLYWLGFWFIILGIGSIYFTLQVRSVYGGDAGDLAAAIAVYGIPHPPGYPLYTLLGIIISRVIETGTLAWRIAFLSSIPSLLSFILLYDLFYFITQKVLLSVITVLITALLYPLWLYSVVVEVFALNNLFTILLLWLMFHWFYEGKSKYLYLASFTLGLSLTHHHIIVFLIPALFYLLTRQMKKLKKGIILTSILLFFLGLVPYIYVLIASFYNPPVNWQGPPTFTNFINLVTRAGYGTFQAGSFIAHQPFLRLLNIWAFWDFVYKDFRILGLILLLSGFIYLIRKEKTIFRAVTFGCMSYLFFLFYASFPLTENFMVGTFERFIQPLYLLFSIFLLFGMIAAEKLLMMVSSRLFGKTKNAKANFFERAGLLLFIIYPLGLFILNYPKISILKNDFTAENLGRDILNSIPADSVLIISTDTPLFNTQYVYYAQKKWPDVKLVHLTKLYTPYYSAILKKYYPELFLPSEKETPKEKFETLIGKNYEKFPIFSKLAFSSEKGIWLPHGLLFRYYEKKDMPTDADIAETNEVLWNSYNDPLTASLSRYDNLLLSDVLRVYALSHLEIGYWAAKRGLSETAENHLLSAERLYPDDLDSYIFLAQSYISGKKCKKAQDQIEQIIKRDPDTPESYLLSSINYSVCYKDEVKAAFYKNLYGEKTRGRETPLRQL